ncbi:hypothetical protein CMO88_04170 [Candidatus Woesearchaeota archaeon]|nr:hypothetical protein [Candidatus Woesearchaeota archaeon]|tara:strand:+ start:468 stop:767 length:300 start_codon:yes stop_codon:yes gene_type:complete
MAEYTPEGLPVVTEATMRSYIRDLTRDGLEGNKPLMNGMRETFERDNEELVKYTETVDELLQNSGVPKEITWQVVGFMTGMYEIMRRQAEADKLENQLG